MADYKYEEHRCPYCEHQFVVEMSGTKYILRGSTEEHIRTSCPNCGYKLFVASRWKYGCLAEFVPKEDIKIVSLRI